MKTYMNDDDIKGLDQVRQFLTGNDAIYFESISLPETYQWIAGTLKRFKYFSLRKKEKSVVKAYIRKQTGYSRAQLTRLIKQYGKKKWIGNSHPSRNSFEVTYSREDLLLLAEVDECHQTLSGPATKKICERAYLVFRDNRFKRLSRISISHLYNLRRSAGYQNKRRHFTKTKRTVVPIGERRKPCPNGEPGYLRIDTVHQGDLDGIKGVYYINAVDEVTQMELVFAVEKISEQLLIPILEMIIDGFPFEIKEIHSDNGSEYINAKVAELLQKLFIELTKSRARHSNDNALVECKNGAVIRKLMGYIYIPQRFTPTINLFFKTYVHHYLNYHRPCYFAEEKINAKGKIIKTYPYKNLMTPYEKLKSLPEAKKYLRKGLTFEALDKTAHMETDTEVARKMRIARKRLFEKFALASATI